MSEYSDTWFVPRLGVGAATLQEIGQLIKDEIEVQSEYDGADESKDLQTTEKSPDVKCVT